jgi:hypothetical protein
MVLRTSIVMTGTGSTTIQIYFTLRKTMTLMRMDITMKRMNIVMMKAEMKMMVIVHCILVPQ